MVPHQRPSLWLPVLDNFGSIGTSMVAGALSAQARRMNITALNLLGIAVFRVFGIGT
jgi:hypothetical protein